MAWRQAPMSFFLPLLLKFLYFVSLDFLSLTFIPRLWLLQQQPPALWLQHSHISHKQSVWFPWEFISLLQSELCGMWVAVCSEWIKCFCFVSPLYCWNKVKTPNMTKQIGLVREIKRLKKKRNQNFSFHYQCYKQERFVGRTQHKNLSGKERTKGVSITIINSGRQIRKTWKKIGPLYCKEEMCE